MKKSHHRPQQELVKVRREKVATCMTCPLCHRLFKDATTISECLHTFCRNCIYNKINDEGLESCPVCNIGLGGTPTEKLRADHSLDDLRAKIFPSRKQKFKATGPVSSPSEFVPEVPSPSRRKERSLSSLVVSTPRVLEKPVLSGKRWKSIARKAPALRESFVSSEEPVKKVNDCLSSPERLIQIAESTRLAKNGYTAELCNYMPSKDTLDNDIPCEGHVDLPKPLNFLIDAASKTKPNKSNLQDLLKRSDPQENEAQVFKSIVKEHVSESKVNGDENYSTPLPSGSVKRRRLQGNWQKEGAVTEGLNIPAQDVIDSNSNYDGRFSPIWFSLIASDDQEGQAPLPQISSCYLRVRDGNLPISSIKKYLVQKLDLASDSEVEISVLGHPVVSTLQLHNVVDWWLKMSPISERIKTTVGSSGKDFVMVLSYSRRKAQHP